MRNYEIITYKKKKKKERIESNEFIRKSSHTKNQRQ